MTIRHIPGAGPDPRDQPQRSLMAWRRTAFALIGVGLILTRSCVILGHPMATVVAMFAEGCAVASLVTSQRRLGNHAAALEAPPSAFAPLLLASVATVAIALAALPLVLLP